MMTIVMMLLAPSILKRQSRKTIQNLIGIVGFVIFCVSLGLSIYFVTRDKREIKDDGLDVINNPNTPANTWTEMNQVCTDKGKRLCNASEMCISNKPIPHFNIFDGKDNWMAVNDKPNEWVTYWPNNNRLCKTHTQVANAVPAWGTNKIADPWFRAAKCCPK